MLKKPVMRFDCVNKTQAPKASLLRLVKTPEGKIEVDPSGKMNGRGVYLAPTKETLAKAIQSKALERALQTDIPEEVYQKIGRYIK